MPRWVGGCLFERERCHLGHFLGGNIECLDLVILRLCSKSLWGLTDSTQIWTQHLISTDTRISNLSKEKHSFTSLCPYRFFHHVLSKEMVIEREYEKGAKGESERKKKKCERRETTRVFSKSGKTRRNVRRPEPRTSAVEAKPERLTAAAVVAAVDAVRGRG